MARNRSGSFNIQGLSRQSSCVGAEDPPSRKSARPAVCLRRLVFVSACRPSAVRSQISQGRQRAAVVAATVNPGSTPSVDARLNTGTRGSCRVSKCLRGREGQGVALFLSRRRTTVCVRRRSTMHDFRADERPHYDLWLRSLAEGDPRQCASYEDILEAVGDDCKAQTWPLPGR